MGARGFTEIDFGTFPGGTHATVAVTGQTGILSGSHVEAWLAPGDTDDHSSDEHILAKPELNIVASDIVAGTGFTIHGLYLPILEEPLNPPTPSTFRPAAATVHGYTEPSVGGVAFRTYGKWRVAWVWA